MTNPTVKQASPNKWQFNGQHTRGQIRYHRIGLIWRYEATTNTNPLGQTFGTLEMATQWLTKNDKAEQRSPSHA